MTQDAYPLGKPMDPAPKPEPDWLKKLKARNTDNGLPPGITRQPDGKWQTSSPPPTVASYCPHLNTMLGVCVVCGTVVVP